MIVIKGDSDKSVVLKNFIQKDFLTDKIVVLDSVGVSKWNNVDWATIYPLGNQSSYHDTIRYFENSYEPLKGFDWVVFYVDADEDSIQDFKSLDRRYPQNIIVALKGNNGLTTKYYI